MSTSMLKGMLLRFLLTLFVASPHLFSHSLAQKPSSPPDGTQRLLQAARDYYTLDDKLINGFTYPMPDSRIDGHPWLDPGQWSKGTLYIGNNLYKDVLLKYDITREAIVLKAEFEEKIFKVLELPHPRIDSFKLGSKLFVRSDKFSGQKDKTIYYEQIINSGLTFLRHHTKYFISKYDDLTPYGRFSETQTNNYFIDSDNRTQVNHRWQFIRYFSKSKRKAIRKYFRQRNIKYGKASSTQLKNLLKYCNSLTSKQPNQ